MRGAEFGGEGRGKRWGLLVKGSIVDRTGVIQAVNEVPHT